MRIGIFVVAAGCFFLPGTTAQPLDPNKVERAVELKRLEGGWVARYLVTEAGVEPYPLQGRAIVFTDTFFARMEGNRTAQAGGYRIDPAERGLDLIVEQADGWDVEAAARAPKLPFTIRCAYRVVGDLLTVCTASGNDRPADLKPGEGRTVVVYERQKAVTVPKAVTDLLKSAVSVDGTWILQSREPAAAALQGQRIVWCIEDDRWTCWVDGKSAFDLTATFDAGDRVTLTVKGVLSGPRSLQGQVWKGRYRVERDRLTVCVDPSGREFPTELASRPDGTRILYSLARAKGIQPEEQGGAGGAYQPEPGK